MSSWLPWIVIGVGATIAAVGLFLIFRIGIIRSLLGFFGWAAVISFLLVAIYVVFGAQTKPYGYPQPIPTPSPSPSPLPIPEPLPSPELPSEPWTPPTRGQMAQTPQCALEKACTLVKVLYGTNRKIDFAIPAEQDGDYVDDDLTPFLDEPDLSTGKAALGFVLVSVPKRATVDDNELFRPHEPNRVERYFNVGPRLDGAKHYVFRDYDELSEAEFKTELAGKKRAFVYIHGYQEPLITAAFRAAQIKTVGNFDGQAIIFSWPSIKGLSEANYFEARRNAVSSAEKLRDFLRLVSRSLGTDELHIIAHSMGNYALLEALDALADEDDLRSDQVIMAAPDVSVLEYQNLVLALKRHARGATLYASRYDVAMKASRAACQLRRHVLESKSPNLSPDEVAELATLTCDNRAGFVPNPPKDVPVLADGVTAIDASFVDKNTWFEGIAGLHGYAFEDPQVFLDIGAVMDRERREPIETRGRLACVTEKNRYCADGRDSSQKVFWRFY